MNIIEKVKTTNKKTLLSVFGSLIIMAAIPLTVFVALNVRNWQTPAAGLTPLPSWIIPSAPVVVLKERQVCPLLTWPNDANVFGQDGGSSVLAGNQSFMSFGDTALGLNISSGMIRNNIGQISNLDASSCPSIVHKQFGGYATALMPSDTAHGEAAAWPDGMVQVMPGFVHFFYASGDLNNARGVGLAKFSIANWNTQNAVRVPSVFWENGTTDLNGDGKSGFGVTSASAFENGGYVYLFFGQKLGRVADANIENMASYQFWNGSAWLSDLKQATDLWTQDYVNGISVSYNAALGKYVALYSDTFDNINGVINSNYKNYVRVADAVTGPWSDQVLAEDCNQTHKMAAGGYLLCYAGRQHQEFAKNNGNTIYYSEAVSDEVAGDNIGGRLYLNELTFGTAVNQWNDALGNVQLRLDGQTISGSTNTGIVFYASKAPANGLVEIHEWKDPVTGEYQYQKDSPGANFIDNGIQFYAPSATSVGLMPTYRWDSTVNLRQHIYTPFNLSKNRYVRGPKVFYSKLTVTISPDATGYDLLNHPEKIGKTRQNVQSLQVSSHQKSGGNYDAGSISRVDAASYYLYQENGNYVLLDEKGPGTVNRIWMTWGETDPIANKAHIQFYFDGEVTPRYDMSLADFFSGKTRPFSFPFVNNYRTSSGGNVSYLPIPFSEGLKIEVTSYPYFYYNIGYEKYDSWESVSSLTGQESTTAAASVWQHLGLDPKPTTGNTSNTGTVNVGTATTTTIFQNNNAGSINSIKLIIPQLVEAHQTNIAVSDDYRVFVPPVSIEFYVNIDSANSQIRLKRRLDQGTGGQSANVAIDGVSVGSWAEPAVADTVNRWRDSYFTIPSANTAGKTRIKVTITPTTAWTDFHYWVYSKVNGVEVLSDELDSEDKSGGYTSENRHSYTINGGGTLEGLSSGPAYNYPPVGGDKTQQVNSGDILTNTRIKIYFNGEATPSVDAPIGAFFGSYGGMVDTKSLMFGMDPATKLFYNYYSMPYVSSVKVDLVNSSANAISNLSYDIATNPNRFSNNEFHATFNSEGPTTAGNDYKILNISGQGQVVGNVMYMHGLPVGQDLTRQYLEGDERIQIDGSKSPNIYGTGTEDYFNGAYYFDKGYVNRPSSGYNLNILEGTSPNILTNTGAYRLYNTDPVDFHSQIRMGIEHGDPGMSLWDGHYSDWPTNYYSLAFWYGQTTPGLSQTGTINVGDSTSEVANNYSASGSSSTGSSTFYYEGDDDLIPVTFGSGSNTSGTIQFKASVNPQNSGIVIRRSSDQNTPKQQADVSVNGLFVGTWYTAGNNVSKRWRDDDFVIPGAITSGQSNLNITLVPTNGVLWNAYKYQIYQRGIISSPPPDTNKPNVTIISPVSGQPVSKTIPININATDNVAVSRVEVLIDSQSKAVLPAKPYIYNWDTYSYTNGPHTLSAKAYDAAGNVGQTSISVNINNPTYVYWVHIAGVFESGCCGANNPTAPITSTSNTFTLQTSPDPRGYTGVVCSPDCSHVVWTGPVQFYPNLSGGMLKLTPTGQNPDNDADGFSNTVEQYVGTNPNLACGANSWPPDFDNDGVVSILDLSRLASHYGTKVGDAGYSARFDLNGDGAINIIDLSIVAGYFLKQCGSPPF